MATYELYVGGVPRTENDGYAIFPTAALDPDLKVGAADHKQGLHYGLTRVLDFTTKVGGDQAFQIFNLDNPPASGDVYNIIVTPADQTLVELHWDVVTAGLTGLTWSLTHSGDAVFVAPVAGDVEASAVVTSPTVGTWPLYATVNDFFALTLDSVPAGGMGDFKIAITPVMRQYNMGQF